MVGRNSPVGHRVVQGMRDPDPGKPKPGTRAGAGPCLRLDATEPRDAVRCAGPVAEGLSVGGAQTRAARVSEPLRSVARWSGSPPEP